MNQGRALQITREIFQVGGSQLTSPEDAAIYLINFAGHAALVDAGRGDAQDPSKRGGNRLRQRNSRRPGRRR